MKVALTKSLCSAREHKGPLQFERKRKYTAAASLPSVKIDTISCFDTFPNGTNNARRLQLAGLYYADPTLR
jgi:hypothetical protein